MEGMDRVRCMNGSHGAGDFAFGRFAVLSEQRQLLVDGEPAKLGARAFDVLLALIQRRDRVVSKNELLDVVWPGMVVEENNLYVQINTLRKLLGPRAIVTIPGRGYRFAERLVDAEFNGAAVESIAGAAAEGAPLLLGREDDLNALEALIRMHRLVTVVGPGGIGKTVAAQALARRISAAFTDGACIVELAPVSDPSLVATTVATALGIKLGNRLPLEAIAQELATRRMLLVLDNCEHLLRPVAQLVKALDPLLPGVRWLATSQEPLKVAGEQVFRIHPLALPTEVSVEAARQAGAVALFEARAHAADPRFSLTSDNVSAAIDICRKLDGNALAIELAAARVSLLGIEGLRCRLGERFRVLTGGSPLALPRHQTLRSALEWSHGLLNAPQQIVFRRLGVFAGSFSLEAAQRVAASEPIDEWAVLDALGSLIEKSLVVAEPDTGGEPRYRLLETMRHYALDRLDAAGDAEATRRRHLDVFVELAEKARNESFGPQQGRLMQRLDLDLENLLAAHAWCDRLADGGELGLLLVTGLFRYWLNRALYSLGYRVMREALSRPGAEGSHHPRCEALAQAGYLAGRVGRYREALRAHEEAIQIARKIGAQDVLAETLTQAGRLRIERGDLVGARAPIEEALGLSREAGSDRGPFGTAINALGELERLDGNWDRAQQLYEAALAHARQRGDLRRISACLNNLAMTAMSQGSTKGVRERTLELAALSEEFLTVSYPWAGEPLILCAGLAALRGDWERSARFEGAATVHFARVGWPLAAADRAYAESVSARTRAALGEAEFERLRAAGRDLAIDDALAQVRQYLEEEL